MNAFNSMEGILGDVKTSHFDRSFGEFMDHSRTVRDKLGKQAYLFDWYLSLLLEAVNSKTVRDTEVDLFGKETLLLMCLEILRHKPKDTHNPVYDVIKSYVDANPLPYQEETTKQAVYCSVLYGEILKNAADLFHEELTAKFRAVADIVDLRDLYRKICAALGGEEEMEKLNLLFRQRFLVATPAAVFMQGMTNQLISLLLHRDNETSKQVFQLLLDEAPRAADGSKDN